MTKTRTSRVSKTSLPTRQPTIRHALPLDEVRTRFADSQPSQDNHLKDFLYVMKHIETQYRSWTFSDVIYYAKNVMALDVTDIRKMFDKYVNHMVRWNKLVVQEGCLDEPIHITQV